MPASTITQSHRALLTDALVEPKPFYGEGVWSFPADHLNLFLAKDPFHVDLSKDAASDANLQKLAAACDAATFGMDQKDVLDESYRKAGKLDRKDFGLNIDIVTSGLLQAVHTALFSWEDQPRSIAAELYKLNVYGPGSFFKAHKDTPRGDDMFGSLVLNFPTKHEGGALVLRHDGREHIHDASAAAYTSGDQVSWIAFYSDVEHEVLPVTSGYRVTLTYNLYFTKDKPSDNPLPPAEPLLLAFKNVLGDESFLPTGGRLGFGLKHQYPIPVELEGRNEKQAFQDLSYALKGSDRAVFHTAELLGLKPKLAMAYELEDAGVYLLDSIYAGRHEVHGWEDEMRRWNGEKIESFLPDPEDDQYDHGYLADKAAAELPTLPSFDWIVPRASSTRVKSKFIAYGNQASMGSVYGDLVLIITVPPKDERAQA
ncbi:hypothetical protein EXIGLDRAFT_836130 [Exidia glandulosa HHB12029]|uniref:Fe2OG dioxygenase domain-containing protein n=1 Tax=Exidia glandulosa HHB12029 TaxID=1314781 RepID=A0A165I487_EXIGL|nr:hypothetical protein EXIGLDRAFT_836130 [Exidia glandulosa HHB12029]